MANRFFVNGGSGNWSDALNWSLTSNGAGGQAAPTSSDDVFFDASSPSCTLDTSARVCQSLNCTGYTNTLTFNQQLTVGRANTASGIGWITLGAAMLFAGSSPLIIAVTALNTLIQLKSNGKICPQPLQWLSASANTITLQDEWINTGLVTIGAGGTSALILNGAFNLKCRGGLTQNHSTGILSGAATIYFDSNQTATWQNLSTGAINNPITINRSGGTLTLGSSLTIFSNTITHTAGTVDASNTTLNCGAGAITFNCSGITWKHLTFISNTQTWTLSADLNVSGNFTPANTTGTLTVNGAFNIKIGGNFNLNALTSGIVTGSASFVLNGTGAWGQSSLTTGGMLANLEINTAGTITITGTVAYRQGILKFTAGTVLASGSTLRINSVSTTVTCNMSGLSLGTIESTTGATITVTFNGSNGFTFEKFIYGTTGHTYTFKAGLTWNITLGFYAAASAGAAYSPFTIQSDTGSSSAFINLSYGAQQFILDVTVTDIDSSGGRTIYNYSGTRTRTVNWATTPIYFPAVKGPEMQKAFAPKNTVTRTLFQMCDANTGIPTAGLTGITAKYGVYSDAATPSMAAGAGTFTDLGNGGYTYINVAAEINGDYSQLEFSKAGYVTTSVLIDTLHAPTADAIWDLTDSTEAVNADVTTGITGKKRTLLQLIYGAIYHPHRIDSGANQLIYYKKNGSTVRSTQTLTDAAGVKTVGDAS